MTDPITPKATHRVIDGKVLHSTESKKESHSKAQTGTQQPEQKKTHTTHPVSGIARLKNGLARLINILKQWSTLVAFLALFSVIAYLIKNQDAQNWQIDTLNRLQTQVEQLKAKNRTLNEQQALLAKKIQALKTEPNHQPAISQADIDAIKTQIKTLKQNLANQVENLTAQASQTVENLTPSDASTQALKQQLAKMGQQISTLFQFKQEVTTHQPKNNPQSLNSTQIKKWTLAINTEWILNGDQAQTRQALLALRQAVSTSDLPNKIGFASLIGEDLAQIENAQKATAQQAIKPTLKQLKQQLKSSANAPTATQSSPPVSRETPTETTSETASSLPALERLKHALKGVFSIQKRTSDEALTRVDSLLLKDAIEARSLLLIDRLNWALQLKSNPLWQTAVTDLSQFIDKYYPQNKATFTPLLNTLSQVQFLPRKPLKIVEGI